MINELHVGCKVKFEAERGVYTVKARSERFAICTKPFNPKRTVIYTIVDFKREVRGTNNLIFNIYDYAVQADIDNCLRDLEDPHGVVEVSHRNCVDLDIEEVKPPPDIRVHKPQPTSAGSGDNEVSQACSLPTQT
jgi:hypothetical protein